MNSVTLVSVGSVFTHWEPHAGSNKEIVLFLPILQQNVIEVGNERSFFGLQVFVAHLRNNQKKNFRGGVCILVSAESGRERVVLLRSP